MERTEAYEQVKAALEEAIRATETEVKMLGYSTMNRMKLVNASVALDALKPSIQQPDGITDKLKRIRLVVHLQHEDASKHGAHACRIALRGIGEGIDEVIDEMEAAQQPAQGAQVERLCRVYMAAMHPQFNPDGVLFQGGEASWKLYREGIQAIISSLSPSQDGWQPIETAPRDGSGILLHMSESDEPKWSSVGFWQGGRFKAADSIGLRFVSPTLWMPIPSAPKTEGQP